jgi:hypothetical protein
VLGVDPATRITAPDATRRAKLVLGATIGWARELGRAAGRE